VNEQNVGDGDIREELRELIRREGIELPAIARECDVSLQALIQWLSTDIPKAPAFVARVEQFISDRAFIWLTMSTEASNQIRDEFGLQLVQNAKLLADELGQIANRDDLRAHLQMYLGDIGRLVRLMSVDETYVADRLLRTLQNLLKPGDKMVISRASKDAPKEGISSKVQ
jgi:hypothetical protein